MINYIYVPDNQDFETVLTDKILRKEKLNTITKVFVSTEIARCLLIGKQPVAKLANMEKLLSSFLSKDGTRFTVEYYLVKSLPPYASFTREHLFHITIVSDTAEANYASLNAPTQDILNAKVGKSYSAMNNISGGMHFPAPVDMSEPKVINTTPTPFPIVALYSNALRTDIIS